MSSLVVGGVAIPVAPGSGSWDWSDAVDRRRAFDNTYRASATGGAARDGRWTTPPVTRANAAIYRAALQKVDAQLCTGDLIEIPTMCCSELIDERPVKVQSGSYVSLDFALHEVQGKKLLLKYSPGDTITGESFTASTTRSYVDANGVVQDAAINTKRDSHYVAGARSPLFEDASINLCLQSENFGLTWNSTGFGTPTRVAAADTANGVTLDRLGDDDAAVLEGYAQTITFTGNGTKGVSFHVKKGTSTSSAFRVRAIGIADRIFGIITWSGTVPVVTIVGAGSVQSIEAVGGLGVYRVKLKSASSLLAAQTNDIQIFPASDSSFTASLTGDILIGGVQAENLAFCTSYKKTTTATVARGADTYSLPFAIPPQEMTFYMKFVEMGTIETASAALFAVGASSGAPPLLAVYAPSGFYTAVHNPSTGIGSPLAVAPVIGDTVEIVARLFGDGSVDITQSINGGNATSGAQSAAMPLASAWSALLVYPNGNGGIPRGFTAIQSLKIVAGSRSLSEMRSL